MTDSNQIRVGWIGTGVMGSSMCGHLLDAGHPIALTTRTRERARDLLDRGAVWADTPAAAAARSDVVFAIVGFPSDVREVFLGADGALSVASPGSILVDMTTSEPSLAVEIHAAAKQRGVGSVDAPVSGGDIGARNASLSIMVGGEPDYVARVRPLFEKMGTTIVHQGGPGSGQHTKLVNQILVASNMVGIAEALLYARQAGLDLPTVLESVSGGAAGSWSLSNLAPRIIDGNFDPGFFVDHFVKDMGIALEEAAAMKLATPGLTLAHKLYVALQGRGHGRAGTQALPLVLAGLSGLEWED
jgi:3-hydroxyisobutyrate dehydrogenase